MEFGIWNSSKNAVSSYFVSQTVVSRRGNRKKERKKENPGGWQGIPFNLNKEAANKIGHIKEGRLLSYKA